MNISVANYEELLAEFSSETTFEPVARTKTGTGQRRDLQRRRRKSPQQFNGIHRRRAKKIRW